MLIAQSCLTLFDPMECSLPGFSIHGILQARILEWVAIPFPRDPPDPGIEPRSPALQAVSLPSETPGKLFVRYMQKYILKRAGICNKGPVREALVLLIYSWPKQAWLHFTKSSATFFAYEQWSHNTIKLQYSNQHGTGTKTGVWINGTEQRVQK